MTYGQISRILGQRLSPRAVGWAMHACPEDVPWQRVVNASGGCSTDRLTGLPGGLQRALLEQEGVRFAPDGRVPLDRYQWRPGGSGPASSPPRRKARKATTRYYELS